MIHSSSSQHWLVQIYERGLQELLRHQSSVCLPGKGPGISQNIPGRCIIFMALWGTFFTELCSDLGRLFHSLFQLVNLVVNMEVATHSKTQKKQRNGWNSAFKGLQKMDCLHIPKEKWAAGCFCWDFEGIYNLSTGLRHYCRKNPKWRCLKLLLNLVVTWRRIRFKLKTSRIFNKML